MRILKIILKLISTIFVPFYVIMVILEGIYDSVWTGESLTVSIVLILEIVAVLLVWVEERVGKWFLTGVGLIKMIMIFIIAGHNIILAGISLGAPLIIPGFVLILLKDKNEV